MIVLHRLNGKQFVLNGELVRSVEATPDTLITLVGDEKLLVRESIQDVIEKIVKYKQEIFGSLPGKA